MSEELTTCVRALPDKPGVYIFRNERGEILYVGKAASLRARVRSYFGSAHALAGKTRNLVGHIADFEYITTNTEQEALHLEATLVKRHQPFYNVRLKDDKHYPYLKIDVTEPWPRVYITRRVENDGARYFGPYASAGSVRTTLDLVKKLFPWRSCTKTITGTDPRPCLDYYIHRCIAPCTSYCTPDEYHAVIDQVILFLEGRTVAVEQALEREMGEAAKQLQYERAAQLRDQLAAVRRVTEAQVTATTEAADIDVFGLALDGNDAVAQVFFVRGTKMTGRDHFALAGAKDESRGEVLASFLKQFYESAPRVPRLVLLPERVEETALLAEWLSAKREGPVELRVPERGEKRRLVAMANDNAQEALEMLRVKWMADRGKTTAALEELEEALSLPRPPHRIECYDISNIQGSDSVASMVVFLEGNPEKSEYRRFKIKTVEGADDFASMAEVLQRRFKRLVTAPEGDAEAASATEAAPEAADQGWGARPDLVVVDGGKGQLSAALDVLRDLGLADLPAVGLAKREEEIFVADMGEPIRLDRRSQGLYLLQRVRDEAHRFAITYHRGLRKSRGMASALDEVPGVGPKRKKALLRKFGTIRAIREAETDAIASTAGMTRRLAETVKERL